MWDVFTYVMGPALILGDFLLQKTSSYFGTLSGILVWLPYLMSLIILNIPFGLLIASFGGSLPDW